MGLRREVEGETVGGMLYVRKEKIKYKKKINKFKNNSEICFIKQSHPSSFVFYLRLYFFTKELFLKLFFNNVVA